MVGFDHFPDRGSYVILQSVDGRSEFESEAKKQRRTFEMNQAVAITIQVRHNRIAVLTDGESVLNWQGDFSRLTPHDYFSPGPGETLGVASQGGPFTISRWSLVPVKGTARYSSRCARLAPVDRQIAARAFAFGAGVKLDVGERQLLQLTRGAAIPKRPFYVAEIEGLAGVELSESDFRGFGQRSQLQRLNLENAKFDESSLSLLSGLNQLLFLGLNGTTMTDRGLVHLSPLHSRRDPSLDGPSLQGQGSSNCFTYTKSSRFNSVRQNSRWRDTSTSCSSRSYGWTGWGQDHR